MKRAIIAAMLALVPAVASATPSAMPRALPISAHEQHLIVAFAQEMRTKVYNDWNVPTIPIGISLKCTVEMHLNPQGQIVGKPIIVKSSGNQKFNQTVITAVEKGSPFTPPAGLSYPLYKDADLQFGSAKSSPYAPVLRDPTSCASAQGQDDMREAIHIIDQKTSVHYMHYIRTRPTPNLSHLTPGKVRCIVLVSVDQDGMPLAFYPIVRYQILSHNRGVEAWETGVR